MPEKFQTTRQRECDIATIVLLAMRGIYKSFGSVPVLQDVRFDLNPGEAHVLAGENGAGKTTLIKILAGVHTDFRGEIELNGHTERFSSPHDATRKGIAVIHQEMSLVGTLPVIDNIFLGREFTSRSTAGLLIDHRRQRTKARELCSSLGLDIDLQRPADDFPLSVKYRIEIAKALASNARILVMDEPTSALSEPEVENLFGIIAGLKRLGSAIIYITHRMDEIYRIGDRITVLRDGRWIGTAPACELAQGELIRWMIGRELSTRFPQRRIQAGEELWRVDHFSVARPGTSSRRAKQWLVKDVSFAVRSGEILGVAGLAGSGNSVLLAALFGTWPEAVRGQIFLDGKPFRIRSPRCSIDHGVAHVTGDRAGTGLISGFDVAQNISLASLNAVSSWGILRRKRELDVAREQMRSLAIRATSPAQEVRNLSGGNQQKVLLAKWLETHPKVLLLDEPTRGVDIGSKHEIYALIHRWTAQGIAVLLITSELPELIGLADRILVMHRGRISAEFSRGQATQEAVLRAAMGEAWTN